MSENANENKTTGRPLRTTLKRSAGGSRTLTKDGKPVKKEKSKEEIKP